MDAIQHQRRVQHLFWRAGFGASPELMHAATQKTIPQLVKQLLRESREIELIQAIEPRELGEGLRQLKQLKKEGKANEEIRAMVKDAKQERKTEIVELTGAWMMHLGHAPATLREKMTLFWHNHFACRSLQPHLIQQQNNLLRTHALGNFGELLMSISKDPAMLQFLNNQQNRKKSPNENFAREVMELFTLGRGHYSERDIKEAARAFTGWGFNLRGEFVFRERDHDDGDKTIFGKTGPFKGEDVVKIILENRQTAQFVSSKLYRFLVNEKINTKHVEAMSNRFYSSGYDIADLLEYVYTADWFYDSINVGAQIKSPVELLTGMQRTLKLTFNNPAAPLQAQRVLGQQLFFPPNVAGWPGGQAWIDSSSLLTRMQLPSAILRQDELKAKAKESGDVNDEYLKRKRGFEVTANWGDFAKGFEKVPEAELPAALATYLLQVPVSVDILKHITQKSKSESRLDFVQKLTVGLMSLPEYQVC